MGCKHRSSNRKRKNNMNPAFFVLASLFLVLLLSLELGLHIAAALASNVSAIAARSARFRDGATEACVHVPLLVIFAPGIPGFHKDYYRPCGCT